MLIHNHPLSYLRSQLGLSAEAYLERLNAFQRQLGLGSMAVRREKMNRWEKGRATPSFAAQRAIAALHGIPARLIDELPWPEWLYPVCGSDVGSDVAWDYVGTVAVMTSLARGESMDRRAFLIMTSGALTSTITNWQESLESLTSPVAGGRRQITAAMVDHIEQRLDHLRHLDDALGSGELREMAHAEFGFVVGLLRDSRFDETTGRRLYSAAAEASRVAAWINFDAGYHALAQRYFVAALRASASANDSLTGAYAMSFQAVQCYTVGDPRDSVALLHAAQEQTRNRTTPRFRAMLAAREARALSKTGDRQACLRALGRARDALAAGPHDDDPPYLYWVDQAEIEMIAGSSSLEIGDPREAINRFSAAIAANYEYPRSHAIYLARAADAHMQLMNLDEAIGAAEHAVECLGGVASARSTTAFTDLQGKLAAHRSVPLVADFLERTAWPHQVPPAGQEKRNVRVRPRSR